MDRLRLAEGLERFLVVAEFFHDRAEARERAEMAWLKRQHVTNIGERVAVVLLRKYSVARRFQASMKFGRISMMALRRRIARSKSLASIASLTRVIRRSAVSLPETSHSAQMRFSTPWRCRRPARP